MRRCDARLIAAAHTARTAVVGKAELGNGGIARVAGEGSDSAARPRAHLGAHLRYTSIWVKLGASG